MKTATAFVLMLAGVILTGPTASAQFTLINSIDPPETGGLCSLAYDPATEIAWAYTCSRADVQGFATDGTLVGTVTRPGEAANDVDLDIASAEFTLGETVVPAGALLFFNGETDSTEVYAIDTETDMALDTLVTRFGNSHVVGGAFHPTRGTLFLLQDNVPGAADENRIAEIDPATGDTVATFQIGEYFNVSYGDLDVCATTGHLFVVSSVETTMAEFTPDGAFREEHALPDGVGSLSGISIDCAASEAWVGDRDGAIHRLSGEDVFDGEVTAMEHRDELPRGYTLSAPYPTPFNPQTTFTLSVEQPQHVRIAAYSLLGRQVAMLHEGVLQAGTAHTFTFDAGGLPSGVYLIRVVGERFAASTRAVLQK